MSSVALSRSIALGIDVRTQMQAGASLEKALDIVCRGCGSEEKAAAQSVTYTATRHCMAANFLLRKLASRSPSEPVKALLLVVLSLLIEEPEKSYAIVNEAVCLAKSHKQTSSASGFINACLRRFGRERETLLELAYKDKAVRLNAPMWWINKMSKTLGNQTAQTMLELQRRRPPMILRANRRKTTNEQWCREVAEQGIEATPIGLDGILLASPLPVDRLPGFRSGIVSVQDAGAQLAAQILAPQNGERILDACAAPGGKTAHLLELADIEVTALEKDPIRAKRINDNLSRLGLNAQNVVTTDAGQTDAWWDGKPFDSVLLDAPCTASGIVRRHPDIVFSRRPEDIDALALQQKNLLDALWPLVKVGGKLLYVVCSVFEEEGSTQIKSFLDRHADAEQLEIYPGLPASLTLVPTENMERQDSPLPAVHDGFFYALLVKRS